MLPIHFVDTLVTVNTPEQNTNYELLRRYNDFYHKIQQRFIVDLKQNLNLSLHYTLFYLTQFIILSFINSN